MKDGQLEHLDDAMLDGGPAIGSSNKVGEENDGNGTAYEDRNVHVTGFVLYFSEM